MITPTLIYWISTLDSFIKLVAVFFSIMIAVMLWLIVAIVSWNRRANEDGQRADFIIIDDPQTADESRGVE